MRIVTRIDASGFFIEDVILGDDDELPTDCVESRPGDGMAWPLWNGKEWEDAGGIYERAEDGAVDPSRRFEKSEKVKHEA